ncbi:MAG: hypothetical protein R3Y60_03470 [bacterium]
MITYDIMKNMHYIFLAVFLIIFFGIIIFAFINNKNMQNNNPNKLPSKPIPFLHKILVGVLLISLPMCAISSILLRNMALALVFGCAFGVSVVILIITASTTKITLTINKNGKKEVVQYTMQEYQRRIYNGTLDVNSIVREDESEYTDPKSVSNDDDPFAKFD